MENLLKNKKAKLLTIWWFIVICIIAIGVIIATLMFYGKEIDVRGIEADSLSQKVLLCLVHEGKIDSEFAANPNFNVLERCGLNEDILTKHGKYFLKISLSGRESKIYGSNFETDCNIAGIVIAKKYPRCTTLTYNDGAKTLEVMAGANYEGGDLYETQ